MTDILERVCASVLPPAAGSILVLTFPPETDWNDADFAVRVSGMMGDMKDRHGFAGVIAIADGFTLQSFDKQGLARLGLQVIPRETEGEAA